MTALHLCRICGSTEFNLKPINSFNGLQDLITSLLEINWLVELSKICQNCVKRINDFEKFKQNAHIIDEILRENLAKCEAGKGHELIIKSCHWEIEAIYTTSVDVKEEEEEGEAEKVITRKSPSPIVRDDDDEQEDSVPSNPESIEQIDFLEELIVKVEDTVIVETESQPLAKLKSKQKTCTCEKTTDTNPNQRVLRSRSHRQNHPNDLADKYSIVPVSQVQDQKTTKFACQLCGRSFSLLRAWKRHYSSKHNATPLLYECYYCQRKFGSKSKLQVHIHRHLEVNTLICYVCGATFFTQITLNAHIKRQLV